VRSSIRPVQCSPGLGCRVPAAFTIALIDDDESFRTALAESLSSFGFEVIEYASGEDFISNNGLSLCDLVVSDVHMPGMSGLDITRHVAVSGTRLPVVLITARSEADLEDRAAAAGAVCFLKKPFEIGDLIRCIEGARGA
jgi:FixJ family two-component response regulator